MRSIFPFVLVAVLLAPIAAAADEPGTIDWGTAKCSDFVDDDVLHAAASGQPVPQSFKPYYYFSTGYFTAEISRSESIDPAATMQAAQIDLAGTCIAHRDMSFLTAVIAAAHNARQATASASEKPR